jgi:hypothetical protein
MNVLHLVLFCITMLLTHCSANAGAYRHDKPAEKFRALAQQPQFDCVGQLMDYSEGRMSFSGSCVLVHERFVLTAAHVLTVSDYRQDTILERGMKIIVNQPYNTHAPTELSDMKVHLGRRAYGVRAVHILPAYLDSGTLGNSSDLALVELDAPVATAHPAQLNRAFDELHSTLTGVGWGESGPANKIDAVGAWNEKIAGQNLIDSLGGAVVAGKRALLIADFDCPDIRSGCNRMGSELPLPLEYGVVSGDSGCGAFRMTATGWELIGVLSGNGGQDFKELLRIGYYGQLSQWVRISVYADWIERVINGAGK